MIARKILRLSCIAALILLLFAAVVWGLRMTAAVGNLFVEMQILKQRVDIISPASQSEKEK